MVAPVVSSVSGSPIAIVSHTIPGDLNGQAVMLDRLSHAPKSPGFVFIDTDRKAKARPPLASGSSCHPLGTPLMLRKLFRVPKLHSRLFSMLVRQRSRAIARVVVQHGCQSIVACTGGDMVDLPASVEAGQLTGRPTFLYYFDDYRFQWTIIEGRWSPQIASQLRDLAEPRVLKCAQGVITPNETLADDVRGRTDTPVRIVRNPVDTGIYRQLRSRITKPTHTADRPLRIVYTGSIYAAQADSLRRLCDAIDLLRPRGISLQLHVYGPPPCQEILDRLPVNQIQFHPPVSTAEAADVQVQADLLFLPLSFDCGYPELIRTSAPGKFGEYLASGTPVLVHAPAGSFPVTFVSTHGCAAACDVPESRRLADTLSSLLEQPEATAAISQRAIAVAEDFAEPLNRQRFLQLVAAQPALAAA
jgi:glycosyltransferase involved in cell wall biosynthesis